MSNENSILSAYVTDLSEKEIKSEMRKIKKAMAANKTADVYKKIYASLDLTSLNTTDTKEDILKVIKIVNEGNMLSEMPGVAGICVFPNFVEFVKKNLTAEVKIVSVAGGFPSSQTFFEVKKIEVEDAVVAGAHEIDAVMNLGLFFENDEAGVVKEIQEIKNACGVARLKIILETGALKTPENIIRAALLAMMGGADFIKSSTGKVYKGVSEEDVYAMCHAVKMHYDKTNKWVGIKVSGGINSVDEVLLYYTIVREVLGDDFIKGDYFRVGSSKLQALLKKEIMG
ncbi:MAG: deoxyribose-phosphate aldolase [Lactobacillales bacterium]|jgi:deoxyribose-phosphate aldolase|nr:deoxyribose-phosphate aldolase [Lactobacillales bacterium]